MSRVVLFALCSLLSPFVVAQTAPADDVVLASNATTSLTRAEYETELLGLPQEMRYAFSSDRRRVAGLIDNLLLMKTLAQQARAAGLERDPAVARRLRLESDRLLAKIEIEHSDEAAGKDFDARLQEFMPRAREIYLVDKAKYQTPPTVSVSEIMIDTSRHTAEEALALAQQARAKLLAGADMAELARAMSEDASAKENGGRVGWFAQDQRDPAYAKAAFALQKPGDISEPVRTAAGYYVLRLEGKRAAEQQSFEQVRQEILSDLRKKYIDDRRAEKVVAIRSDPKLKINEPAMDALGAKSSEAEKTTAAAKPDRTPAAK